MAMGALFIGWGAAVRGRETRALQVFQEALAYYGRLQQQGEIQSFEPVALEPHGGDLGGFLLVKGDANKLARLRTSDEFIAINTRAQLVVENFGVAGAFVGDDLQRLFADFEKQATELR
jgi:hypothetical protein